MTLETSPEHLAHCGEIPEVTILRFSHKDSLFHGGLIPVPLSETRGLREYRTSLGEFPKG